jgi:branched-chain amino acid transport system permease protein
VLKQVKKSLLAAIWILLLTFPLTGIRIREVEETGKTVFSVNLSWSAFIIAGVVFACGVLWCGVEPLGRALASVKRRVHSRTEGNKGLATAVMVVKYATLVCLAAALLSMPHWGESRQMGKYLDEAIMVFIFVILALGLNITIGWTGLLVLGYAAFFGLGAYTYAILSLRCGFPFWPSLILGGLVASLAGLILGIPSLRLRGDYLAIVTLGFGETVRYLLKNLSDLTGGEKGLPNEMIPGEIADPYYISGWSSSPGFHFVKEALDKPIHYYYIALAMVVLTILALRRLNNSRIGRAWVAIREDEVAARAMGINTFRMKVLAFVLSSFFAGVVGVLYAARVGFVNPEAFKFECSVLVVAMVIFGGMGSIAGATLGAAFLWLIPWALRDPIPKLLETHFPEAAKGISIEDYRLAIFGGILVLMMIFRPQGLIASRRASFELGLEEKKS